MKQNNYHDDEVLAVSLQVAKVLLPEEKIPDIDPDQMVVLNEDPPRAFVFLARADDILDMLGHYEEK